MDRENIEKHEWFRIALNSIGDAVITTDVVGKITFMNPVAEILTGWGSDEASGKPLKEVFRIINEYTRKPVENPAEKVLIHGKIVGLANHTLLIAKDGSEKAIADSGAPIRDSSDEVTGVVLVFRDVSEERKHEKALEKLTHDLRERVKEINCLYSLSAFIEKNNITVESLFNEAVETIRNAVRYPGIAAARIKYRHNEFKTENFKETSTRIHKELKILGESVGFIEVCYPDAPPGGPEENFTEEEKKLLDEVGERMSQIAARLISSKGLKDSEAKYRLLIENLPQKIFIYKSESVFSSCNANFARDLGISSDDIENKSVYDLFPADLAAKYAADNIRLMKSGRTESLEEEYVQDEQRRWVQTVKTPLRDAAGNVTGLIGIFWDITERKLLEKDLEQHRNHLEELVEKRTSELQEINDNLKAEVAARQHAEDSYRESEEWLATTLNSIGDAVIATDSEGCIRFMNPVAEKLTEWSASEAIGKQTSEIFRIINEETRKPVSNPVAKVLKHGIIELLANHTVLMSKSGKEYPIADSGAPIKDKDGRTIGVVLVFRDVTEQRKAEAKIAESEKKYRSLVEGLDEAIYRMSLPEGGYEYFSPAAEIVFGYSAEEFLSKPGFIQSIIHSDYIDYFTEKWADLMNGVVSPSYEYKIIDQDRRERWIVQSNAGIYDESGALVGLEGICRDTTENKRAEEAKDAAIRELEAFAYSVSHDLRAPLRAISGYAQAVREDYADKLNHEGNRFLGLVQDNAKKMGQLIDDLLAFSRLSRQEMVKIDIDMGQLAEEVYRELKTETSNRQIDFTVKTKHHNRGDRSMLKQVFANLISNAVKFSAPKDPAVIEIGDLSQNGETVYYVKDNGVGFDMQYAGKLFGVFQRLHSTTEFEGTGVGLAIAQRIISRHGGRVWAEGKLGEGAAFYFSLPK